MKKSLIMIVDDDYDFNNLIAEVVKKMGHEAIQVYNGAEALNLVKTKIIKPQLVLCDVKMPEMSGIEFVKENKKNNLKLNICMMTGLVEKSVMLESLQLGATDFVTKPIDLNSFSAKINQLLET